MSERDKEGERLFAHVYLHAVESREYAPPLCMLALGKTGEGAYVRGFLTYLCDDYYQP